MNIETLFMFSEIVETGSMTRAAEKIHISQPALTQQIKTLEHEMGCRLLERSNKGVRTTSAGEIVYRNSLALYEIYHKMTQEIESIQKKGRVLHVAANPAIYSYALPCTLFDAKKNFPDFTLEVSVLGSLAIENKVLSKQADIGFIAGKPENKDIISKKVFHDPVYLTTSKNISLKEPLTLETLYDLPLLMLHHSSKTSKLLFQRLEEMGMDRSRLQIPYTLDSVESLKQSTINGYGIAFLPYMTIKKELYMDQLSIIELKGFDLETEYYMLKSSHLKTADKTLLELVSYLEKTLVDTIC